MTFLSYEFKGQGYRQHNPKKDYRIGTLRYNWLLSAHASQALSTSTVPIRKIYLIQKCTFLMEAYRLMVFRRRRS